ncbi:hypothetical protein Vretimale_17447, partial [Volvox reticuliferus]
LHRAALLNNVRARLSGNRENAAAWGASGEPPALTAAAMAATAGAGAGGSLAVQPHPADRQLLQAAAPAAGAASTGGGGSSASGAVEAGDGSSGGVGTIVPAAAASASDAGVSGGTLSSADGPSPFREYLHHQQQQQQQQQQPKLVPYCSPVITTSGSTSAGGAGPMDADGQTSRADGGGAPFTLSFSQSLGHAIGHGPLEPVLSPISERSLSADDTLNLGSDCRSCSGTPQGSNTMTSSGTNVLLQTSCSRPVGRKEQNQMLHTIQEPVEETGPLLATATSAPASPGAVHHRLRLRSDPQSPSPPQSLPPSRPHLTAEQNSPSRGSRLAAAAAASVRHSLRRAAAAAAAVAGVLSSRPSGSACSIPRVDVPDGGGPGATFHVGVGAGAGGGQEGESPLLLQATKSLPAPTHLDLAAHPEPRNPQQLQPHSNQHPEQQLQNQTPHQEAQPQHHPQLIQQRHGPAQSADDPNIPPTQTTTTTTTTTVTNNLYKPPPGGAVSQHPHPPMAATAGYGSRGSRAATGISQLPRGETMAASATASATVTGTVTVTLSSRPSRERVLVSISSLVRPTLRELRHSESLTRAMRRVGSLLRSLKLPSLPKFRRDSQFQWVYGLTGQAGSCMYMAPEVFRGEPYNEKVDGRLAVRERNGLMVSRMVASC